jgi:hypothetical protein
MTVTDLTDGELYRIAGIPETKGYEKPSNGLSPLPSDLSQVPDDELYKIAGVPGTSQAPAQTPAEVAPTVSPVTPAVTPAEPAQPPAFWDNWKAGFKQMYGIDPVGTPLDVIKGYGKGLVSGATMGAVNPETSGAPEGMGSQVGQFVGAVAPISAATKVAGGLVGAVKAFQGLTPIAKGALQTLLASGIYTGATGAAQQRPPLETVQRMPGDAALWLVLYGGALGLSKTPEIIKKGYNDLVNSTTWRRMTIPERNLVVQSMEDLKNAKPYGEFKGHSEGDVARSSPEAFQTAFEARTAPEIPNVPSPEAQRAPIAPEAIPQVPQVMPVDIAASLKGPVREMYNFRVSDYIKKGMPPEQAEAKAYTEIQNTRAGQMQIEEITRQKNQENLEAGALEEGKQSEPSPTVSPEIEYLGPLEGKQESGKAEDLTDQQLMEIAEQPTPTIEPTEGMPEIQPPISEVKYEHPTEFWNKEGKTAYEAPAPEGGTIQSTSPEAVQKGMEFLKNQQQGIDVYNPSQLEHIRDRMIASEPPARSGVGAETKTVGGYPEWFRDRGYTRLGVLGVIRKALEKKPLTETQKALLDDLTESSLKEYEAIGKTEIYPDQLKEGQKVIINGEEFKQSGIDPKTGKVILEDGITIKQDIFEPLKVDKVLPVERNDTKTINAIEQMRTRIAQEEYGKSSLEDMESLQEEGKLTPKDIVDKFLNKTYTTLNDKGRAYFNVLIEKNYGKPDADLKTHTDILKYEIPNEFRHLEGGERGLYVLMNEANNRIPQDTFNLSSQKVPITPKIKPEQGQMFTGKEDLTSAMEGKIPTQETPQTPIEKAADEAKVRQTEKEMKAKQPFLNETGAIRLPSEEQVKGIVKSWREFWNPMSTLPQSEKYLGLRYKTLGKIDRTETIVNNIWKKTKDLPDNVKTDMFKFLDGQIEVDALPANVRLMAKSLRTANNLIGRQLVRRGMLDESTFNAHKNQYIRYSYLKHILGDKANISIGPNGKMNLSYLKERKDLTQAQKKAIGLIEDVSIAEPISVSRPLQDIAKHDMMSAIADNPEWTWEPSMVKVEGKRIGIGKLVEEIGMQKKVVEQAKTPEAQARLDKLQKAMDTAQEQTSHMPDDFVQLPTTKTYGPLAGAFVRKSIARDIQPVLSSLTNLREGSKLADMVIGSAEKSMAAFKVGKTALNIPTAFRNTVSNFIQLNMSGMRFDKVPQYMLKSAIAMKEKSSLYVQAKRNGVFKTNWGDAEIGEILKSVREMQGQPFAKVLGSLSKIARYYGKIDDFFKLAKFIEQMENGKSVSKATIEAQKWGMDYSRAHPSIKAARRFIAPFASYQYKITPLLAETMAKRPWVIAKYIAIPYAMQAIARQTLKLTDDDWKDLKARLPFFVRTNQSMAILPWKSPEGHAQWVNLEYYFPWQNAMATYRDVSEGNFGELTSDFGIGNPLLDVYTVAKTMKGDNPPKDPFTGKDIYNRLDSPTEKAVKTSEWIYNKWSPSMLTRQGAAGYTSKIGEKDRAGRTITPGQAAGRWLGFNIIAPTPEQAAKEAKYKNLDLKKSLSQILKDPTVEAEKKQRAIKEYQERITEEE